MRAATIPSRSAPGVLRRDAGYVRFTRELRTLLYGMGGAGQPWPFVYAGPDGSRARTGTHAAVELAKGFIDVNSAAEIDLDFLAREAGVSKFYLVRLFREAEGTTPWAYVRAARIRRAQEMLRGDLPLAEIALLAGFSDQSHFSRVFREATGKTPGQYREECKNVQD